MVGICSPTFRRHVAEGLSTSLCQVVYVSILTADLVLKVGGRGSFPVL